MFLQQYYSKKKVYNKKNRDNLFFCYIKERLYQGILVKFKVITLLMVIFAFCNTTYANTNDMYISYFSPANVKGLANYGNTEKVGGYIIWEISGDMPHGDEHSLLDALKATANPNASIMAYWTDWSVYTTGRAQSITPYSITGSTFDGKTVTNADMDAKLNNINVLAYAFLEAIPANSTVKGAEPGTLYFNDPWADLSPEDSFCSDKSKLICWYAFLQQGKEPAASMGNFEAFANLNKTHAGLKRVISVGGYAHDNTFEGIINNKAYIDNFVNSAKEIIQNYDLDGIDLDYEDPNMTQQQSSDFANLVVALHKALPNKLIAVTMLASPTYIKQNFAPGILQKIADNSSRMNLMTYDFHGAFDYKKGGPNSYTGFLTNLYLQSSPADPFSTEKKFSEAKSLTALQDAKVPVSKISLGIPAYGRALANISKGQNAGLFSPITESSAIVPGDLDPKGCGTSLPIDTTSCSGSFTYHFIVNHLLQEGLLETIWSEQGVSNATTAYGNWTTGPTGFDIDISNLGQYGLGSVTLKPKTGDSVTYGGYIAPNNHYTLGPNTTPSTTPLANQSITVSWTTYPGGPKGTCPGSFDSKQNYHVMINVPKQGKATCDFRPLT